MKIGVYGGSFDPIHTGHAMVANFVAQCNVVDEVWLTVNRKNPLKLDSKQASEENRLNMVQITAEACENVQICDIELHMPYPSYTIDTLKALQEKYPQHRFSIIIGSDSFLNFRNWKESEEIIKNFGVIVYPRPGYSLPQEEPEGFTFLNGAPEFSISSSLIREYVKSGWNINYFVPLGVAKYIKDHKLYQE